ncbi:MAG TPA: peptidase MA family metallohydrolase [Thermodesulfovibrionales bacterium]|nr:peptidase MA family metallohydrolase [Thermodesulfovibrionales bacterium]
MGLFFAMYVPLSHAGRSHLEGDQVIVRFDEPLRSAAGEVLKIYPSVKAELARDLWRLDFPAEIVLVKERDSFLRNAEDSLTVAYAVPRDNLIVIDYSRMNTYPFTLATTLKHELCHLQLHQQIRQGGLPRWLDEGVCQWVTGGVGEIMTDESRSILKEAALSRRLIGIGELTESFPTGRKELLLAYEESRSIVAYIAGEYGVPKVRMMLELLGSGVDINKAVEESLSVSLSELEARWRNHLTKRISWVSYMSDNLYELLFLLAALITVYGFIKVIKRKKNYHDEEDGEISDPSKEASERK